MLIPEKIISYENTDFIRVIEFIRSSRDIRTRSIQRACELGYGKTVRFIEILTDAGLIANTHKYRMVMGADGKRHRHYLPYELVATDKELQYCIRILEQKMDEKNFEDTFNYTVSEDGSVTVTAYTGSGNKAVVPESINGHPVTKIAYHTFFCRESLISITIPDSVLEIESEAFAGCINLKSVTLPSRLTKIDSGLFKRCKSLTDVTLPDGITYIGANAFAVCKSLADVALPSALSSIAWHSFTCCTRLKEITIPSKVISIGFGAFSGCKNLKSITVQGRDTVLEENAISGGRPTVYAPTESRAEEFAVKNGLNFRALQHT